MFLISFGIEFVVSGQILEFIKIFGVQRHISVEDEPSDDIFSSHFIGGTW